MGQHMTRKVIPVVVHAVKEVMGDMVAPGLGEAALGVGDPEWSGGGSTERAAKLRPED